MKYVIEPIGAQFTKHDISSLADRFTAKGNEGYKLHSVFQVSQPGCLGVGQASSTYVKED